MRILTQSNIYDTSSTWRLFHLQSTDQCCRNFNQCELPKWQTSLSARSYIFCLPLDVISAFLNLEINGDGNCRYQQILP